MLYTRMLRVHTDSDRDKSDYRDHITTYRKKYHEKAAEPLIEPCRCLIDPDMDTK